MEKEMRTSYQVTSKDGRLLAPYSTLSEVQTLVNASPGATVQAVVTVSNPCHAHPAYEADNCPVCGTSRMA
jgi:hypothetical protein